MSLTVSELARRAGVHRDTVYGWITHGVRGPGGKRVRLAALRVGGLYRVGNRAWKAFLAALNPGEAAERAEASAAGRARSRRAARSMGWE